MLGVVGVGRTAANAAAVHGLDLADDVEIVHVKIHVRHLARDCVVDHRCVRAAAENPNVIMRWLRDFRLVLVGISHVRKSVVLYLGRAINLLAVQSSTHSNPLVLPADTVRVLFGYCYNRRHIDHLVVIG